VTYGGLAPARSNIGEPSRLRAVFPDSPSVRNRPILLQNLQARWVQHFPGRAGAFRKGLNVAGYVEGQNVTIDDAFFGSRAVQFATLTARDRIPAAYTNRDHVVAGGLMSYGPTPRTGFVKSASMPAESSRAPSRPTCRSRRRPSSYLLLTWEPRGRSASRCRRRCSRLPTR
jgi:hypothetical protein